MSDLTVFVNSTDSYRDCWGPFFTLLHRYWPDCRHEVVLNTEHETFAAPGPTVRTTRVGSSRPRRSLTWSESTAIALAQVRTPFILYLQEDYFIEAAVRSHTIDSLVDRMVTDAIDCIQLFPTVESEPWGGGDDELRLVRKRARYRVNLQAALWRTPALASTLRRHESPWQLEYWGSRRLGTDRLTIYAFEPDRGSARVIPYERTGVVAGRWNRDIVVPLFAREGIDVDFSKRGFLDESSVAVVKRPLPVARVELRALAVGPHGVPLIGARAATVPGACMAVPDRRRLAFEARSRLGQLIGPRGTRRLDQRYIRSVVERYADRSLTAHVRDLELLSPACIVEYPFRGSFGPEFRRRKTFDDRYLLRLSNVRVYPRTGLVQLPDRRVLGESYGSLTRVLGWGRATHDLDRPAPRRIERPVVALPDPGYFHWLLEVLPAALLALERSPDAALVTTPNPARYVEDALKLLAPGREVIRSSDPLDVSEITFAGITAYSGFVHPQDVEVLRRVVLPLAPEAVRDDHAVFVSRRGSRRSPENEAELERALAEIGFRTVRNEDLSFLEQVAQFRGVHVIAGVHGAGLANLVWARDLRALIEVFSADFFNDCYARLAVAERSRYEAFTCDGEGGTRVPIELVAAASRAALRLG